MGQNKLVGAAPCGGVVDVVLAGESGPIESLPVVVSEVPATTRAFGCVHRVCFGDFVRWQLGSISIFVLALSNWRLRERDPQVLWCFCSLFLRN